MNKALSLWLTVTFILATGHSAHAQQSGKVYRIGFLSGGFAGPTHWTARLRAELQKFGYVEGKNLVIDARYTENKIERLPGFADELVKLKPDVITTGGMNDARAAKNATKTIPIVGLGLGDPVANGLVESLARPGGNLTGFTNIVDELAGKRLELLKEVIPKLTRVALLYNSQFPDSARASKLYQATAKDLGLQLQLMDVTSPDQFVAVFKQSANLGNQALAMTAGPFLSDNANQKRIANMAAKYRLPSISDRDEYVDNGGLMSYGADDAERFQRVAVFINKVLKGTRPADIPVEQPKKFEFVVNLKTAKQIGVTIPQWTLAKADRVIR